MQSIKFELEKFLLANNCKLFLQNYLVDLYDDIESGKIKFIIVPIDVAILRLEQASGKTIQQISNSEAGLDILNNHISTETPNTIYGPGMTICYHGRNGVPIPADYVALLKMLVNKRLEPNLQILIVDNIIHIGSQLVKLKNRYIPDNQQLQPQNYNQYDLLPSDVLRKIALNLPLKDLKNYCTLSRRFNIAVCSNDNFWNEKLRKDYPGRARLPNKSFKRTYQSMAPRLYICGYNTSDKISYANMLDAFGRPLKDNSTMLVIQDNPIKIPNLSGMSVTKIACGAEYSLAVIDGKLYAWGNGSTLLGIPGVEHTAVPTLVPTLSTMLVTKIACGSNHSLAVANGQLYAWGSNIDGQLGLGDHNNRNIPTLVPTLDGLKISKIAAGQFHTCIIADGKLYTCGSNLVFQLGIPGIAELLIPTIVPTLDEMTVTKVVCGSSHTAALANDQLYIWGNNGVGQLGPRKNLPNSDIPMLVFDNLNISHIASGANHMAIIADGKFYLWGDNRYGQLGLSHTDHPRINISFSQPGFHVSKIFCGLENTFAVINDQLYAWGYNKLGTLGLGNSPARTFESFESHEPSNIPTPTLVSTLADLTVSKVVSGQYTTLFLAY